MNKCKGCNDFTERRMCFIMQKGSLNHITLCPCRDCLIKVMCSRACDEYAILSDKVEAGMVDDG